ncbi:MAG: hypothetical protein MK100_07230 [Phycisphaerales bacterium]|nr:hypothetical protein [Phycisphaerales bacterium]
MRAAAIDIGSNSVKLSVGEMKDCGTLHLLRRSRVVLQLGRQCEDHGSLGQDMIDKVARTVRDMQMLAMQDDASAIAVVATSAAREASDGQALQMAVQDATGLDCHLITGEQEALLSWSGLQERVGNRDHAAMVDIGGGSTEVVIKTLQSPLHVVSMPLGAIRLSMRHQTGGLTPSDRLQHLADSINEVLGNALPASTEPLEKLMGTGGTLTAIALLARQGEPLSRDLAGNLPDADQHIIDATFLADFIERMARWELPERVARTGLSAARAEIVLAGAVILECVRSRFGAEHIQIHEQGIRDGLLRRLIAGDPIV